MNTLLMVAVVLIAVAIVAQAGVLVGMYMMSRKLTNKVNGVINDSRTLIGPLETITINLKDASDELVEVGKIAREQAHRVEATVNETRETIRIEVEDLRDRIVGSLDDAKATVMRPLYQWTAIAQGVAEGFRTLFRGTRVEQPPQIVKQETPAA
jgi:hypothetical protein